MLLIPLFFTKKYSRYGNISSGLRIRIWIWFTDPYPRGLIIKASAGSYMYIFVAIEKNMVVNKMILLYFIKLKEKIILFSIFFESMIKYSSKDQDS